MICVSADETDDGLNSKTEEGQWRQLARTLDWKNRPQRFGREDEGTKTCRVKRVEEMEVSQKEREEKT